MTDTSTAGVPADDGIVMEGFGGTVEAPEPQVESPAEPVAAPDDEPSDEGDQSPEKKKNGWARQRDRYRNENAQLKARIAELEGAQPKPVQQAPKQDNKPQGADPEPKVEDFKDVLEYTDARAEWKVRQAIKAYEKSQQDAVNASKEEQALEQKVGTYREQAEAMLEKVPDFYERVDDLIADGQITKPIQDAVLDSPMSAAVTLHLLNNPTDLQKMQVMSEAQAYRAVALIEAHIQNTSAQPDGKTVAKPTKAAAPITPVGRNASTKSTRSLEDIVANGTQQEFDAAVASMSPRRK